VKTGPMAGGLALALVGGASFFIVRSEFEKGTPEYGGGTLISAMVVIIGLILAAIAAMDR
jgi:hypothetical protein